MCSTSCPRALADWLAGCAAETGVICAFALVISALASGNIFFRQICGYLAASGSSDISGHVRATGIPAAVVIWLSEKFQIHSIWFFGTVGAAIGGLSQTFLLTAYTSRPAGVNLLFLL